MRSSLLELPVFLCCIWGGLASGAVCALTRLPRRLYYLRLRGRRARFLPLFLFVLLDVIAAAALTAGFSATLLFANGGELRLYAVFGFAIAAALSSRALMTVALGKPIP